MSLNLDKSTWKRVAFGDVVNNVNETVRDAEAARIDRIVGMEHLDPGELKIQRWGSTEDGTTFTRRVKPGQTLFGKRRAYQRKVGYAEFEAICSGDIYTFEADQTQLLGDFLPFIVQSNEFFDHALDTSAGSLSPRTNWRDLTNFEFHLPPLDEQKRIADLLWAVERHRRSIKAARGALANLRTGFVAEVLGSRSSGVAALGSLIRTGTTVTYGIVQAGREVEGGVPYIRVSDMTAGVLGLEGMKRTAPEIAAKFARSRVQVGDLVVALRGRTGLTLRVPPDLDGANLTQGTARVAIESRQIDPAYVAAVMNSEWMALEINRQAKGSTFTELTLAALRSLPIPRLGREVEAQFVSKLDAIDGALQRLDDEHSSARALQSSISASVCGDI